jgi:hypothetical protein
MTAALAVGWRRWIGRRRMLGCITALGGGTIRDVLLGHYPLARAEPFYLALTAIAAFATILMARRARLIVAFLVLVRRARGLHHDRRCRWQMGASPPIVIVSGMITDAPAACCAISSATKCRCCSLELYASVSVVTDVLRDCLRLKLNDEPNALTLSSTDAFSSPSAKLKCRNCLRRDGVARHSGFERSQHRAKIGADLWQRGMTLSCAAFDAWSAVTSGAALPGVPDIIGTSAMA